MKNKLQQLDSLLQKTDEVPESMIMKDFEEFTALIPQILDFLQ
jgi:hypothetical protein